MKRIFVVFCLLSFCIMPFKDIGHTQQGVTILPDNILTKFKVCVDIPKKEPSDVEIRLRNFIKRELRAIDDVSIVSFDDDWHFLMSYSILEVTYKSTGDKTGRVSIAFAGSQAVSRSRFKPGNYPTSDKAVYTPIVGAAYWDADNLQEYAIHEAESFDEYISTFR